MSIEKDMTYRVRVDDSDFQAKLSMMRASMDATMGGMGGGGGMGGMGGMSPSMMMSSYASFSQPGFGGSGGGIGYQMPAVGYKAPTVALTPNMGQVAVQQGTGTAMLGASVGVPQIMGRSGTPSPITMHDYMALSARQLGDSVQRGIAAGTLGTGMAGAALLGAGAGAAALSALGPVGSFVGGAIGGTLGAAAASPIGESMAARFRIDDYLANTSFRYFQGDNTDPVTGRGMSRQDRGRMSEFLVGQDRGDFRVNMQDVEQILGFGTETGMFEGTQDIEDFKRKFESLKDKVKRVTAVLGTTAKEGVQVMKQLKGIGLESTEEVTGAIQQADAFGLASGRTAMEMMAVGLQGAEIFKGTGVDMSIGFKSAQMNLASVRQGYNAGLITKERISQAGGEEALAQQLTANSLAFAQSGQGRMMMMAGYQGGGLNLGAMGGNLMDLAESASRNMSSTTSILELSARQEDILSDLGTKMGGLGLDYMQMMGLNAKAKTLQAIDKNLGLKDAMILGGKQMGMSRSQIDARMAQMSDSDAMNNAFENAAQTAFNKASMEDYRDKSAFMHATEYAKDKAAAFFDPEVRSLKAQAGEIGSSLERFISRNIMGKNYVGDPNTGLSSTFIDKARENRDASGGGGRGRVTATDRRGIFFGNKFVESANDKLVDGLLSDSAETLDPNSNSIYGALGGKTKSYGGMSAQVYDDAEKAQEDAELIAQGGGQVNIVTRKDADGQVKHVLFSDYETKKSNKQMQEKMVTSKEVSAAQKDITGSSTAMAGIYDLRKELSGKSVGDAEQSIKDKFESLTGQKYDASKTEHRAKLVAIAKQIGGKTGEGVARGYEGAQSEFSGMTRSALDEEKAAVLDDVTDIAKSMGISSDVLENNGQEVMTQMTKVLQAGDADTKKASLEGLRKSLIDSGMETDEVDSIVKKMEGGSDQVLGSTGRLGGLIAPQKRTAGELAGRLQKLTEIQMEMKDQAEDFVRSKMPQYKEGSKDFNRAVENYMNTGKGALKDGVSGDIAEATQSSMTLLAQHQRIIGMIRENERYLK